MKLLNFLKTSIMTFSLLLTSVLADYPNPWSSSTAIQKALDQSQNPTQNYYQLCDHAQANFYGWGGSGFPSALDHWNGIGNIDKHPGDWSAPAGAFQFWGGDQYGHIALSMGNGKIASNDILRKGDIDIVDASLITQKWGLKYLGWTTPTFMGHAYGSSPLSSLSTSEFIDITNFYELSSSRQCLMVAAKALYDQRNNEIYTGDVNKRWDGIFDNVMPPSAPKYSDCSSAVSWIYWTCFKDGSDFINGENWNDGYTGTLDQHGTKISLSSAQPGDLVFYGNPIDHVAIYIGSGRVISHGSDPVCNCDVHYRNDLNEVRTYLSSSESSEEVDCYQPGCSDFDYDTCLTYPYDCEYVDFQGCVDKRDLMEEVDCDNLNRQQCLQHSKECIYIGCSYGCPGCMFRNETTESMYDKALEQDVIQVDYHWKHSDVNGILSCAGKFAEVFTCGDSVSCLVKKLGGFISGCESYICPKLSSGLMKWSPICQIYCEHHHCKAYLDNSNLLSSIQSEIQHSTSDYWGHSTSAGPDGGVEACAWAVNNIMSMSGLRKIGDNPDYVPSVVGALKSGRGRQIQASQAVAGDLVVACGEQHIGVCMEDHCNTIDSNSSSRRCFCWRAGFNFDNYFNCGPATYWRVDN